MKRNLTAIFLLALLAGSAYASNPQAVVVHNFVCKGQKFGACPDGAIPNFLLQASDGNSYGTATYSGTMKNGDPVFGGTIFALTPAGKFTLLHTFTPGTKNNFANGASPVSLTEGSDGNLYGFAEAGGNGWGNPIVNNGHGYGLVFRVSKTGSGFQVIHRFCSVTPNCVDGANFGGFATTLLAGTDGNIYGLTGGGGSTTGCGFGGEYPCGTIFRITPSTGTYEVVYNFTFATTDSGFPENMVMAADGTFYGIAGGNGLSSVVFHFTPGTGSVQLMSWSFPFHQGCFGAPACIASSGLVFGPDGDLHGLYSLYDNLSRSGLYVGEPDGKDFQSFPPFTNLGGGGPLLLASDGNFWLPRTMGTSQFGDIVVLSPSKGTVVRTLTPFSKSVFSPTLVIQVKKGSLLGVSSGGKVTESGHFSAGTVFSLNAGLSR